MRDRNILVDVVLEKGGTSNRGNTWRRILKNPAHFAYICNVSVALIEGIKILWIALTASPVVSDPDRTEGGSSGFCRIWSMWSAYIPKKPH